MPNPAANLRLAIVTPRFWPLVGDSQSHALQLAESLIALGHATTVVTARWKRSWPEQMTVGNAPLLRLRGSPRGGWSTLRWMYSLANWLREHGTAHFDGVIVCGLKHEAYVALGAAQRTGVPTLLLAAEDDLTWHKTVTLGARIAARCREAGSIVAATSELAHGLQGAGFAADCVTLISRTAAVLWPCSAKSRDDARAALATANYDLVSGPNSFVALAVGRLDENHRFSDLVRAWRIVTARRPEARLWIVGDGPEREKLYQQIGDLDQRFRAVLPGTFDCLDELLSASDALLVPGEHAVPPMIVLQAQSCGIPVIASPVAAASTGLTHEHSGLVYATGNIKALADTVTSLIERPGTAVSYATAARDAALKRPQPEDEAQAYIDLIRRQLSAK